MWELECAERRAVRTLPLVIIVVLLLLILIALTTDHRRLRQEFTPGPSSHSSGVLTAGRVMLP